MKHFNAEELAAARAEFTNHWIVEVVTAGSACLIAIEATKKNFETRAPLAFPDFPPDMLDGGTIDTAKLRQRTRQEAAP